MTFTYQLDCGHSKTCAFVVHHVACETCCELRGEGEVRRAVVAVECREWKVTCHDCRYARWCGQSQGSALRLQSRHAPSHGRVTVDYLLHEGTVRRMKMIFGSKIKVRVVTEQSQATLDELKRRSAAAILRNESHFGYTTEMRGNGDPDE